MLLGCRPSHFSHLPVRPRYSLAKRLFWCLFEDCRYNKSMNTEYYKNCTKCGRPQTICKGECCNKPKKACIKPCKPGCPNDAVIPTVTVNSIEDIKGLQNCFVHVVDINTTYYIDDKNNIITTWSGLASVYDYDFDANPLNLRNQVAYDASQNIGAIYDKQGNMLKIQISPIDNDYNVLNNKPSINGVTLVGNRSLEDLGIQTISNSEIDAIIA